TVWPFRLMVTPSTSTIMPSIPTHEGVSAPSVIDETTCMPHVGVTGPGFGVNAGGRRDADVVVRDRGVLRQGRGRIRREDAVLPVADQPVASNRHAVAVRVDR